MGIDDGQVIYLTDPNHTSFIVVPTGEQDDDGNLYYAECVFDGANRERHTSDAVIGLAKSLGWKPKDDLSAVADVEEFDLSDAEEYLDSITPEGWSFGWNDGDFFLANDAWWSADA